MDYKSHFLDQPTFLSAYHARYVAWYWVLVGGGENKGIVGMGESPNDINIHVLIFSTSRLYFHSWQWSVYENFLTLIPMNRHKRMEQMKSCGHAYQHSSNNIHKSTYLFVCVFTRQTHFVTVFSTVIFNYGNILTDRKSKFMLDMGLHSTASLCDSVKRYQVKSWRYVLSVL